ncbi:MAG TPA: NAD-dependent epimerase/dehydratase family protein [Acidobacteriota bacterium]|nr:NAD-dependent epimerase/dehydratase family protein [Acidobacteriota bacterium]
MEVPQIAELKTVDELESALSEPYPEDVAFVEREIDDDVLVLGAGGKMGPTLTRRLVLALRATGKNHRVFAVSRYSNAQARDSIAAAGAHPIASDLLDAESLRNLPSCSIIYYLVGTKFGTTGNEPLTWAVNSHLPGRIARRWPNARIVALSTGNVYSLSPGSSNGPTEEDPVGPVGEYAQSCLGRERVFTYFSVRRKTPMALIRLNYAVEARYGVLLDIAANVWQGRPVSVAMGQVNLIWQGDANSYILRSLPLCSAPPRILNVTGTEKRSVRGLAERFGKLLNREVTIEDEEGDTALISDATLCRRLLGPPKVQIEDVISLVSRWVAEGRPVLGRPTHFDVRDGAF